MTGASERVGSAAESLDRLREGNGRFATAVRDSGRLPDRIDRPVLLDHPAPFAIILGCADSRVPPEIIFDQGLGDLFVIRVAGNTVGASVRDGVEFAVEQFDVGLVVVLGHSECAAVLATLEELARPLEDRLPNPRSFIDDIRPSVESVLKSGCALDPDDLVHRVVRANIRASVENLWEGSSVLGGEHLVIGAEYSMESGRVEFFEGLPETG